MDILKMLADLRAEREQIEQAIQVVERLAAGTSGKRRGRPPKWISANDEGGPEPTVPKKTRVMSAATRKRMADAQKKRWAARNAQANQVATSAGPT